MSQPKSSEELMTEFDKQQRLFLAGKLHSTKWNVWFKEVLAQKDTEVLEAVNDIIKMADALELECGKDGDKGTKQWMAFKGFRNTIRDKYLTN